MLYLKLTDGLGNQMFQYAYARYVQTVYGEKKLYLDVTKLGRNHVRDYGLSNFVLNKDVVIPNKLFQYSGRIYVKVLLNVLYRLLKVSTTTESGFHFFSKCGLYTSSNYYTYFPFVRTKLPIKFVRGFFQNELYFDPIKDIIKREFELKDIKLNEKQQFVLDQINAKESVCVHIRRGDFVGKKRFHVCNERYYQDSINYILSHLPHAVFFVFSNSSDDVRWIKDNYHLKGNIIYIDLASSDIEDFVLMKKCKHFIISNSTYSWWAAYLSDNEEKKVVAPRPWVNSTIEQEGIYCEGWHVINVS